MGPRARKLYDRFEKMIAAQKFVSAVNSNAVARR
jgi:hypothetical protein